MQHIAGIAPWTRAIRSSSDVTGVPYTILFIPIENSREVSDLVTTKLYLLYQLIDWISNVEVIPHISIKGRRWLKGCIPTVLGHHNESEQIVTHVRSQTSTLCSTQTVLFRTGVPS